MNRRVLVVEDDRSTRKLLRRILEEEGLQVDEAADGELAVGALAQHRYGAVILDIALPRLSGTDVMDYVASTDPALLESIVVVTGLRVEEIRQLFPTVCDTLTKPVSPARLMSCIRRCFQSSDASRHNAAR